MLKFIVLLGLAAVALGEEEVKIGFRSTERLAIQYPTYVRRIVGGQDARLGEFPYQISLQTRSQRRHFCGGSILNDHVILTAAHCVAPNYIGNPTALQIVAGLLRQSNPSGAQTIGVKRIIKHPKYTTGVQPNDIAILILASSLKFNSNVQPIRLPSPGAEFNGDTILSGWGSVSNTETPRYPDCLQKATLPLVSYDDCRKKWGNSPLDKVSNICTGPIGGTLSACSGDSGGPLVKVVDGDRILIGVVSWGSIPCGRGYPSVYTKVSSFIQFINQSMS
ncbi:UNVERIFIED_CONTAM: hypothetical protein PYX00_002814 [Menopon gallinae]|uniref:Peptidase S1 domain-containing protein n=1 Tax=Menopon gallinae TaxID=328185 RepID=A0AAW2HZP6_9NEOP